MLNTLKEEREAQRNRFLEALEEVKTLRNDETQIHIGKTFEASEPGFFAKEYDRRQQEKVNHPAHYGGDTVYEAIKVIDAWELGFELGNTVKYIKRAGKDFPGHQFLQVEFAKRIEDLKKAEWYLHHKIERMENLRSFAAYDSIAPKPKSDIGPKING